MINYRVNLPTKLRFLALALVVFAASHQAVAGTNISEPSIAFVRPVFTAAAYISYYDFFRAKAANMSSDVSPQLLNATVPLESWGSSGTVPVFLQSKDARESGILVGQTADVISDLDIHYGRLTRQDGGLRYRVVIMAFCEYVTAMEYANLKSFVENGGVIIFLNANQFLAEVRYDPQTNTARLVSGHGWQFDGKNASPATFHRWYDENTEWTGSNFLPNYDGRLKGAIANTSHPLSVQLREQFGERILEGYFRHEENNVTNPRAQIVAYWDVEPKPTRFLIAMYQLSYGKGLVIHTGIFGQDILWQPEIRFFLTRSVQLALARNHPPSLDQRVLYFAIGVAVGVATAILATIFVPRLRRQIH